jgi:hypothetical protein
MFDKPRKTFLFSLGKTIKHAREGVIQACQEVTYITGSY